MLLSVMSQLSSSLEWKELPTAPDMPRLFLAGSPVASLFMLYAVKGTPAYIQQGRYLAESRHSVVSIQEVAQDFYCDRYAVFRGTPEAELSVKGFKYAEPDVLRVENGFPDGMEPVLSPPSVFKHYLVLTFGCTSYRIPFALRDAGIRLGILRQPLPVPVIRAAIDTLFSHYPFAARISFQTTCCDPQLVWPWIRYRESCFHYIHFPDSFDALLALESPRFRRKLRYEKKRLSTDFPDMRFLQYDRCSLTQDTIQRYLELKQIRYALPQSIRAAEEGLFMDGYPITNCYVMEICGKEAAMVMTSESDACGCLINTAFDPLYAHYSIGKLLYIHMLRCLLEKGKKILYLGSGDYLYKQFFQSYKTRYWVGDFFREPVCGRY